MARKVLIYGGSGGIGSTTGRILRTRVYDVHLVGHNEECLAAVAAELGAGCTAGDVTDPSLFERVMQKAGQPLLFT